MSRTLIVVGVALAAAGLAWPYVLKGLYTIWKLPGNFEFHKGGMHFYFPLTLGLIVSVIFSLLLTVIKR